MIKLSATLTQLRRNGVPVKLPAKYKNMTMSSYITHVDDVFKEAQKLELEILKIVYKRVPRNLDADLSITVSTFRPN